MYHPQDKQLLVLQAIEDQVPRETRHGHSEHVPQFIALEARRERRNQVLVRRDKEWTTLPFLNVLQAAGPIGPRIIQPVQ